MDWRPPKVNFCQSGQKKVAFFQNGGVPNHKKRVPDPLRPRFRPRKGPLGPLWDPPGTPPKGAQKRALKGVQKDPLWGGSQGGSRRGVRGALPGGSQGGLRGGSGPGPLGTPLFGRILHVRQISAAIASTSAVPPQGFPVPFHRFQPTPPRKGYFLAFFLGGVPGFQRSYSGRGHRFSPGKKWVPPWEWNQKRGGSEIWVSIAPTRETPPQGFPVPFHRFQPTPPRKAKKWPFGGGGGGGTPPGGPIGGQLGAQKGAQKGPQKGVRRGVREGPGPEGVGGVKKGSESTWGG